MVAFLFIWRHRDTKHPLGWLLLWVHVVDALDTHPAKTAAVWYRLQRRERPEVQLGQGLLLGNLQGSRMAH